MQGDLSAQKAHGQSSNALLALVPSKKATHKAVRNGAWNNPGTWQNGKIPGPGDRVLIPDGKTVTYNRDSREALDWVRVDGTLKFANTKDTQLVLDTFVVAPKGALEIGTDAAPIREQNSAKILFTTKGEINPKADPQRLGRGIISHGKVDIVGADKLDHVALKRDALKGDRELVLDLPKNTGRPKGWQVGDKLVLGGTGYKRNGRNGDNSKFQDEVLTITGIQGNRIKFTNDDIRSGDNRVLRFDHSRPTNLANKVDLYVANITRNVSFETLKGKDVPTQQRAHAMFMHNPDVNIKHAGFYELGRTDKKKPIDDPGKNIDGSIGNGKNPRGRYGLHIHKTGFDVNDGSVTVKGNAVVGSPGWGIVQHGSKGTFSDNVVFDVVGAAFVTEDGTESGWWINNIAIKTTGNGSFAVNPAELSRLKNYDLGFEGESYWVTGAAQVSMRGNKSISAAGGVMNLFSKAFGIEGSRPVDKIPTRIIADKFQSIASKGETVAIENVPASFIKGFEGYNVVNGFFFWQHMGNNDGQLTFNAPNLDPAHNFRTNVKDFKLWGIQDRGVDFQYSTQIDLENGLIAGAPNQKGNFGIRTNGPSQNLGFRKLTVEGFREGLTIPRTGRFAANSPYKPSVLENSIFKNNDLNLSKRLSYQTDSGDEFYPDYFKIKNTKFTSAEKNQLPRPNQFSYSPIGGLAYQFDASSSFDPDVTGSKNNSNLGIAAYGWDFNKDGKIDDYGRVVQRRFATGGKKTVQLTVWDGQGQVARLNRTFNVRPRPYLNPLLDSTFDKGTRLVPDAKFQGSTGAGFGWLTSGWRINPNEGRGGALEVQNDRKGVAQVIYDDHIRIGKQVVSLDVKQIDRDTPTGKAIVKVWGINGEFEGAGWRTKEDGPSKVGILPFKKDLLLGEEVTGGKNAFRNFRWEVDFGSKGYDFLVVQINATDVNGDRGDKLFIDNVGITSPGQSIQSPQADVDIESPGSTFDRQKASNRYSNATAASAATAPLYASAKAVTPADVDEAMQELNQQVTDYYQDKAQKQVGDRKPYLMGQGQQDIIRGGSGNDIIRGQGDADILDGGGGNDIIVGGRGLDVMSGGLGKDKFRWFQPDHGGDRITDFNPQQDRLEIHGANFGRGLSSGALESSHLTLGSSAKDAGDRFIYNANTGEIFFDRDGTGTNSAVLLTRLNSKPSLTAANIHIL